jgi:microsomal epoxide hydrolase
VNLIFWVMETNPPDMSNMDGVTPVELMRLGRAKGWVETGRGYSGEHATRPGTIGLVLSSSPLALLAW